MGFVIYISLILTRLRKTRRDSLHQPKCFSRSRTGRQRRSPGKCHAHSTQLTICALMTMPVSEASARRGWLAWARRSCTVAIAHCLEATQKTKARLEEECLGSARLGCPKRAKEGKDLRYASRPLIYVFPTRSKASKAEALKKRSPQNSVNYPKYLRLPKLKVFAERRTRVSDTRP